MEDRDMLSRDDLRKLASDHGIKVTNAFIDALYRKTSFELGEQINEKAYAKKSFLLESFIYSVVDLGVEVRTDIPGYDGVEFRVDNSWLRDHKKLIKLIKRKKEEEN